MSYYNEILESTDWIKQRTNAVPEIGIVLGTGLGSLADKITIQHKISYSQIPNFPPSTVKGHEGALIVGSLNGKSVIAQSGRYHFYEGYNMKQVTFPIRVFKHLGVSTLIIASATGGIHEDYLPGDVTIVNDHINLFPENPLRGFNDEKLGPRFPDMVDAYDPQIINLAHKIAEENSIILHDSVYAGLSGPNIETKAEYNYLNIIGATVVGMSTIPEVLVAQHMGLKICVFAIITNKCFPISAIKKVTHEEVIEVARLAESKLSIIVNKLIAQL